MKHLHKFASVLLALVMALSLMVPAFAAEGETVEPTNPETVSPSEVEVAGPQTITITNATSGHTYYAYQIFTGTLAADKKNDGDLVNPVLSDIEWSKDLDSAAVLKALAAYEKDGEKVFSNVTAESTAADVAQILNDGNAADFAQAIGSLLTTAHKDSGVVTGTTATIEDVTIGYYLIKDVAPNDADDTKKDVSLFMLQVVGPTTVVSKVGTPVPDKNVKDINDSTDTTTGGWDKTADHDIGDVLEYQLKATLPANISNYETYKLTFTDKMSAGLTLLNKTSTDKEHIVYLTDNSNIAAEALTVKLSETEIKTGFAASYTTRDNGSTVLTVVFDDVKALANDVNGKVITIEYKAQLNENAAFKNENELTLTYPRNPNHEGNGTPEEGTTPPVIAVVFTFNTILNKTDADMKPLIGAEFKLEKRIKDADGAEDTWEEIDRLTLNEEKTSFTFKGLDDGIYRLTETKAPAGYNKINPVFFKIEAVHSGDGTGGEVTELKVYEITEDGEKVAEGSIKLSFTTSTENDGATTNVVNQSGATLPETGGIGTTIFYIVGGLLTVGAVVLLVTKKRMSVDSDK